VSVLTIFEATPNRVKSLARLALYLGPSSRDVLREHLMPTKEDAAQFGQLLRETARLGFLEEHEGKFSLGPSIEKADIDDDQRFLNHVEVALLGPSDVSGDNYPFRFALSWLLTQSSGVSIPWSSDQHLSMLEQMEGKDLYEVGNEGRFAMLCYWARFLGFAASLDIRGAKVVIPDPTEAIARHLPKRCPEKSRISVTHFLERMAEPLPVIEGGSARRQVEERFRAKRAANQLSVSTSLALWRLEERKVIKLLNLADAENWLMSTSTASTGAGTSRLVSHIERLV
jgi:hypothetical protein